jgi:prevent-host-death family protein
MKLQCKIMKSVGLRDLKNRLSEYVRDVQSGEAVLVTDRGEVVAEIVPAGKKNDEGGVSSVLRTLARSGYVTLGVANDAKNYPKLPRLLKQRHALELLNEERGAR